MKNLYLLFVLIVTVNLVTNDPITHDSFKRVKVTDRKSEESQNEFDGIKKVTMADVINCSLDQEVIDEIHSYQDSVNAIIALFITGVYKGRTYNVMAEMTDTFGPRLAGSQALEDTIDWIMDRASLQFFDKIYTEPVTAPHWVRNTESLYMTSPLSKKLPLLGLGSSIGTPPEGITANVLVVTSFDDLTAKAALANGKIIVYNVPYTSYGGTVIYRSNGAVEAAKVGGVASLVRSITPFSISTPHTGMQTYSDSVTKIPTACITVEDAELLYRYSLAGETITLHLTMGAYNFEDKVIRNTILDINGTTSPEEVVVVSGHLDSWDVGVGIMDDGGACMISLMAAEAILQLNLRPRRTFRSIFFTAEEVGGMGGQAYYNAHGDESENFQMMMESDAGTFYPRGIDFSGTEEAVCMMTEIVSLTTLLGTDQLGTPSGTSDLGGFGQDGVPLASLRTDNDDYFWFHHSGGDTMAVVDSDTMDRVAALWTAVSYVVADVSFRLPQA